MPRPATRDETERAISELADALGWRHHRARCRGLDAEGHVDGFPSDVLAKGERLVFVTVVPNAGLTRTQKTWLQQLVTASDVEVLVVNGDLGALAQILRHPSTRTETDREELAC